jgi:hypothetical protein
MYIALGSSADTALLAVSARDIRSFLEEQEPASYPRTGAVWCLAREGGDGQPVVDGRDPPAWDVRCGRCRWREGVRSMIRKAASSVSCSPVCSSRSR